MQCAEWFLKGGFHQTRKLMSSKLAFHITAMCFFDQDDLWGSISGEGMLGQSRFGAELSMKGHSKPASWSTASRADGAAGKDEAFRQGLPEPFCPC